MSLKEYFRYFNFIRRNWSLRLALFTTFHEIRGERKYGIQSTTYNDLSGLRVLSENKKSAYIYQPVNYYMAEKAFQFLKDNEAEGSLVDYGCGMGRILAVAAHYGFMHLTGVEFAPTLCEKATVTLNVLRESVAGLDADIFCGDAVNYQVKPTDSILTFFNPFDDKVMLPVVRNIMKSVRTFPREIYVVYFNPTEIEIFLSAGFTELWNYNKMEYLDFSILLLPRDTG